MHTRRSDVPRRDRGFTLVELLIVIVILGVLAAVVVLALGAYDQRGERAACETDVKAVEVAVEAFRANEGRYPESLDDLTKTSEAYLRQLPNTTPGSGEYWITYDESTGQVGGQLQDGSICAGELLAAPDPSSTETTSAPGGGGPGGGDDSGSTPPGDDTGSTSPSGGTGTSSTGGGSSSSTSPTGGGSSSSTSTGPNPGPTPGAPVAAVNCFDPPGIADTWDCVVSWSVPSGTVTGYEWQFVPRSGSTCGHDDFPRWWPSFRTRDTSLRIDLLLRGSYCFRVRAENGRIDGPWSSVVPFSWP